MGYRRRLGREKAFDDRTRPPDRWLMVGKDCVEELEMAVTSSKFHEIAGNTTSLSESRLLKRLETSKEGLLRFALFRLTDSSSV